MDARLSKALGCLAFALSSVTAISVAMTIFTLIDEMLLAVIFAVAAVLLDIFKYIGWPLAVRLLKEQRQYFATAICICVVTLGLVSGWATYDRLMNSIEASRAKHSALIGERLSHLTSLVKKDSDFVEALGVTERKLDMESSDLRAKGMITKAQQLESATFDRIDKQRLAAMKRIESNSAEMVDIRSSITKAASIPLVIAVFLCAGFALSLELVPALLLTVLQYQNSGATQAVVSEKDPKSLLNNTEPEHTTIETFNTSGSHLVNALLEKVYSLPAQSKIKVKDFATENKVGNMKSCAAFKTVEKLGLVTKTPYGYLTTPSKHTSSAIASY